MGKKGERKRRYVAHVKYKKRSKIQEKRLGHGHIILQDVDIADRVMRGGAVAGQ